MSRRNMSFALKCLVVLTILVGSLVAPVALMAADLTIEATKLTDGYAGSIDGMFLFALVDADGDVVAVATNDADGAVSFTAPDPYPGTADYTVVELGLAKAFPDSAELIGKPAPATSAPPEGWTFDATSQSVTLGLDREGFSFGWNSHGQLGLGEIGGSKALPTPIPVFAGKDITAIAVGREHNLAVEADGTVYAWGYNYYGQLGLGDNHDRDMPTVIEALSGKGIIAVAAGYTHSLALGSDGTVWAWGNNNSGQLGLGGGPQRSTPTQVTALSGKDIVAISAAGEYREEGDHESFAVDADGVLYAWGKGYFGQLGMGVSGPDPAANRNTPTRVDALADYTITSVSASPYFTLALDSQGQIWSWGEGGWGNLGLGDTTTRSTPTRIPAVPGRSFTQIAAGASCSLAVDSQGALWSWGDNLYGLLGLGDYGYGTDRNTPTKVTAFDGKVVTAIAAGHQIDPIGTAHCLAITSDGTAWSWGANMAGDLGQGDFNNYVVYPVTAISALAGKQATLVGAGRGHSLVFTATGNTGGDMTFTNTYAIYSTVKAKKVVEDFSGDIEDLFLFALLDGDGYVLTTAVNDAAGTIAFTVKNPPSGTADCTIVEQGLSADYPDPSSLIGKPAPAVLPADRWTLDDTVWPVTIGHISDVLSWGCNDDGQLGLGDTTTQLNPVAVPELAGKDITALAAGDYHSLALAADGTVWAWGFNANGQLGDGTTDERTNPTRVTALDGKDIIAVAAGGYHSLALAADGTVWTWGYNAFGQLGLSDYSHRNVPTQVAALDGKDIVAIAGGDSFSLALSDDGRVWAWGENSQGQLGDGTTDQHPSPVEVTGLADVKVTQIAAGTQHSIAVGSDGSLFCWGYNGYGQLGMGDLVDRHTPTQVAALADTQVTAIAAGASHSLALAADGSLWAYGYNNSGQLGVGSHATQSLPVEVSDLADSGQLGAVTAIAAGGSHSLALDAQGALWAWGANANGQLGIGTTVEQTRPVKLDTPADKVLTAFAAGRQHSLAFARIAQPEFVFTNRYIKAPVHPPVQPTPNPMVPTTGDTSNLFSVSAFMLTGCVIMIVAKVRRSAPSKSASR